MTPTSQHTPGPWRYSKKHLAIVSDCYPDWADASDPDQEKITKVCTLIGAMGGHNGDADLAVMVAAPELLAALSDLLKRIERSPTLLPHISADSRNAARAAIAKATLGRAR